MERERVRAETLRQRDGLAPEVRYYIQPTDCRFRRALDTM